MKTVGYGWIKAGETLKSAMTKYGLPKEIKQGATLKVERPLFKSALGAKKDFVEKVNTKQNRKSAKPRFFRVVLEEMEP